MVTWTLEQVIVTAPYFVGARCLDICFCAGYPQIAWANSFYSISHLSRRIAGVWDTISPTVAEQNCYYNRICCRPSDEFVRILHYSLFMDVRDLKLIKQTGLSYFNDNNIDGQYHYEDVGSFCSLVLDEDEHEHCAYRDSTNDRLKYAEWNGSAWEFTNPDTTASSGFATDIDLYSGYPHIMYYIGGVSSDLWHAWKDAEGWHKEAVDTNDITGNLVKMIISNTGVIHAVYYRQYKPAGVWLKDLKHAWYDDSWHTETIESNIGGNAYPDIALDSANNPHVVYRHKTNNKLRYGSKATGSWVLEDVTDEGHNPSICINNNVAHIGYGVVSPTKSIWYATAEIPIAETENDYTHHWYKINGMMRRL